MSAQTTLTAWVPPTTQETRPPAIVQLASLAPRPAAVPNSDGVTRPAWVKDDPVLCDYYDAEWGDPITDEAAMFELLSLLVFQGGLRWRSILTRRELLRAAFAGFSVDVLAGWGPREIEQLMVDPGVIHNRRKIAAVLTNARATLGLRETGGLVPVVWRHQPERSPGPESLDDLVDHIPESMALARELRSAGFTMVGPKGCWALMQASGVVDTNPPEASKRGRSGLWAADGSRTRNAAA